MPFQKGHPQFNTGKTHWKKGEHISPKTEFRNGQKELHPFPKGHIPWMKGKSPTKEVIQKILIQQLELH